ncbi:MAG TPA: response regulator [Azospirillum sp.]|nr:response regulator [Azospirillum sp.]
MPGRPHVLVVDDEPLIVDALRGLFELQGLRVSTAANGGEALHQLAASRVDAVVTDLNMPDCGGAELIGELRRRDMLSPPVIVLTADDEAARTLVRLDNVQILRKPAGIGEILAALSRALS